MCSFPRRNVAVSCALTAIALAALFTSAAPVFAQSFTSADLPGPDGIIYPDWRYAGIAGGIPTNLIVRATITNAQNTDIAAALEGAAATAAAAGGGVVSIPAGVYTLSRPLFIRQSNVVLRGAGRDATTLRFQFQAPVNDLAFFVHPIGATTLYTNTQVLALADPNGLRRISIFAKNSGAADSTRVLCAEEVKVSGFWGKTFSLGTNGAAIVGKVGTGSKELIAEGGYDDNGDGIEDRVLTRRGTYSVQNSSDANATPFAGALGALNFASGFNTSKVLLTADALRGQTTVQLSSGHGIAAGDFVELRAPATDRWDAEVQNACTTSDIFRVCIYQVASITGTSLTFTQPLRIDYPLIDGSYVQRLVLIRRCGVESLTLEQTYDVWTNGLNFSWAFECWVKNVKVKKAGRMPIYFTPAKSCEVRDSICDDAWYKGEGGSAYCGFDRAYDCLMDNMTTYALRHAPEMHASSSGNVIRNSTFYDSDAQWHAGWTNENLYENCVVLSNRGNGGYGYGMWASPPEDAQHGPQGPRNVIYNNDITSPLAGAWLGGMNREWLFLHNRFAADTGDGIFAKRNSGDHIIENNTFLLRAPGAGVELFDPDCTGVEIVNNVFRGLVTAGDISLGQAAPAVNTGNTVTDLVQPASFTNPGFESDLTGWSVAGDNGMTVVSTAAACSGAKGVRVTDASTAVGSSLLSPTFTVTAGRVYAARASCRVQAGNNGIGLYINFYNSAGTFLRGSQTTIGNNPGWRLVQTIETAPVGAATARIWVHSFNAAMQTVDFDDFSFGELPADLPNPGFEYGLEAWDFTDDNGMSSVVAAAAQSGTSGLRVTDASAAAGSSCASRKVPCTPGVTYQVRFWSRIISGSGIGVYLQYFDSTNALIQPPTLVQVPVNRTWTEHVLRAVAPTNAATVRVQMHSYEASIVTADFDSFVFLELPPRPTPAIASIFDWQRNPVFPVANAGFESGLTGWNNAGDNGMSAASSRARHTGSFGVRVTDTSKTAGSSLKTASFPVAEGYNYQVNFYSRIVAGKSGVSVSLIFQDGNGVELSDRYVLTVPNRTSWTASSFQKRAPVGAVSAYLQIRSDIAAKVTADFDDFVFRAVWN